MNIDPRLIALFCILFIALGIYNILIARRRNQQQAQKVPWYEQINILTGIEYFLIALAFLLNISISYHWIPSSLNAIVVPFYILVLVISGVLAAFVIYQGISKTRKRGANANVVATGAATTSYSDEMSPEERARQIQKRRERRQKAAQARRRRAGKA
jgi:hypothetical protein